MWRSEEHCPARHRQRKLPFPKETCNLVEKRCSYLQYAKIHVAFFTKAQTQPQMTSAERYAEFLGCKQDLQGLGFTGYGASSEGS